MKSRRKAKRVRATLGLNLQCECGLVLENVDGYVHKYVRCKNPKCKLCGRLFFRPFVYLTEVLVG